MSELSIKSRIENIQKDIKKISPIASKVRILAVCKQQTKEKMKEVCSAGICLFGENYLKEAEEKYIEFPKGERKFELHMVGTLQNNKVRKAMEIFDCIQSVDSYKLAERINKISRETDTVMPIFIQVNLTDDMSRKGFQLEHLENNLPPLLDLKHVDIRGLMLMAPKEYEEASLHESFRKACELNKKFNFKELSAGMSNDYKIALAEETTMVRLGSVIFGPRD